MVSVSGIETRLGEKQGVSVTRVTVGVGPGSGLTLHPWLGPEHSTEMECSHPRLDF